MEREADGSTGSPAAPEHLPLMPNSGRCEFVFLCARLYVTNGRSDHLFNIVIRIGGASNDYFRLTPGPLQGHMNPDVPVLAR
jgi:hypothetical protein